MFGLSVPLKGRWLRAGITASAGSCYLLFGYDQGVFGGLITHPSLLNAMGTPSAGYLGTIVGLYYIGCLLGCIVTGFVGNKLGRTGTIFWGSVIMVVGAAIQASAFGAPQMIVGRVISGIGNGMNTATVPVWVSECSRSGTRGRAIAIQLSIVIFGTVVAYWLDYGAIKHLTGDVFYPTAGRLPLQVTNQLFQVVWRFPVAFQIVFAIVTIVTIPFLPESPRWLYSNGRREESVDVLSRLLNCSVDDEQITTTEAEMSAALHFMETNPKFTFKQLINDKSDAKNTRRLVLCFMIQFFQQFTGINVIAFYVTIVLEQNVGLSKETSSLVAGFIQIAFWLGTFPPMILNDRFGRRKVLMIGSMALLTFMAVFTAGIAVNTSASSKMALAMLFLFEISFGLSWNSVPWLYAPEITPLHIRHIGSAVGVFSEWLWTFVIAQMTPAAISNTGWRIYLLFCIMIFLNIPFTYFFLPETNGKTLEEIDFIFVEKTKLDTSSSDHISNVGAVDDIRPAPRP